MVVGVVLRVRCVFGLRRPGWQDVQETACERRRGAACAGRSDDVVRVLTGRPDDLHVVVTGRNAKDALIEAADLVTEMTMIKHPFRAGVKAQKGIEF